MLIREGRLVRPQSTVMIHSRCSVERTAAEVARAPGREAAHVAAAVAGRETMTGCKTLAGGRVMSAHRPAVMTAGETSTAKVAATAEATASHVPAAKSATVTAAEATTSVTSAATAMTAASAAVSQCARDADQAQQNNSRRRCPKYSQTGSHDSPLGQITGRPTASIISTFTY